MKNEIFKYLNYHLVCLIEKKTIFKFKSPPLGLFLWLLKQTAKKHMTKKKKKQGRRNVFARACKFRKLSKRFVEWFVTLCSDNFSAIKWFWENAKSFESALERPEWFTMKMTIWPIFKVSFWVSDGLIKIYVITNTII